MQEEEIAYKAINFCNAFGISATKRKRKRYDGLFEKLSSYGITLSVMEDRQWESLTYDLTIGHCDPASLTITVPNKIYVNACLGEEHALAVIFHELGHLLLGHKPVLHFSNKEPTRAEDAEWQADAFAEIVLETIGVRTSQMSLDFYM
ncbi:ImmA/IrrE family metallo-endopeptidase [Leclercia adecarboxylata]|uniref:ImmA/IrrE family metallo-endopeptidase n=1 Tax=Leclercia adecarboxylata TaxID=83655 RepID=UPI0021E90179|nr:ImmA/IrrE family metallo-endopeptidase [Leclercia adecarboxylata]MCV3301718.1 ImmA/IrrE family metallo-endopeptidase [Leclercia adecarboxylata]MCV3308534.1 ImmA/IrrE family metallo-endopeptidase [Leclercia adecarboxylata]